MFAPASGAHKRPRIERIHQTVNKQNPPCKRICLGGGRVSVRSRDTLITGLISRVQLIQQPPIVVPPVETESGAGQPHPSEAVRASTRGWVNLSIEQDLRRYSEIHAETEAASARLRTTLATAGASGAQPAAMTEVVAPTTISERDVAPTTIRERAGLDVDVAPTTISERDVAPTTIQERDRLEVDVAPTTIPQVSVEEVVVAHAAVAQEVLAPTPGAQPTDRHEVSQPPSQPIQVSSSTQTIYSMLQSFAFDDTRSAYNDDEFEYPLN